MIRQKPCLQRMNRGFTLVEIMIALTLLSMLLLLLFGSLHTASRSWQSGTRKTEQNDELRVIAGFIRRQIAQSIPLEWANREEVRMVFQGEHNELTFTSTLPAYRGGGGLYIMTLKVVDSGSSKQLDLSYRRADPAISPFAADAPVNQTSVLLADNIDAIEFAYYGRAGPEDTPKWYDEWPQEGMLPRLVRLKIHSSDPGQNWPVLDIAIQSMSITEHPQVILQDQHDSPVT